MTTTPTVWLAPYILPLDEGAPGELAVQYRPEITQLANGDLVIGYTSNLGTSSLISDRAYFFMLDPLAGSMTTPKFISPTSTDRQHFITDLEPQADGGFNLSWMYFQNGSHIASLNIVEYDADGIPTPFLENGILGHNAFSNIINDTTANPPNWYQPKAAHLSDTSEIHVWEYDQGNGNQDFVGRLFDSTTGTMGSNFTIFDGGAGSGNGLHGHDIDVNGTRYIAVWSDADPGGIYDVQYRFVGTNGSLTPVGTIAHSETSGLFSPQVVTLTTGRWVVGYYESVGTIRGAVFESNGSRVSGNVQVPTLSTTDNAFDIAALQDGGFIFVWGDTTTDTVRGRRYDQDGATVGDEFIIANTTGESIDVEAIGMEDGRVSVVWADLGGGGGSTSYASDLRHAIIDPRDIPNNPPAYTTGLVVGTQGDDTVFKLASGNEYRMVGGNDTIKFWPGTDPTGGILDGGDGTDALVLDSTFYTGTLSVDLTNLDIVDFEEVGFISNGSADTHTIIVNAGVLDFDLASPVKSIFGASGAATEDIVDFRMTGNTTFDASNLRFRDWNPATEGDRVRFVGDDGDQTVYATVGSNTRSFDEFSLGGGDDTIKFRHYTNVFDYPIDGGDGFDSLVLNGSFLDLWGADIISFESLGFDADNQSGQLTIYVGAENFGPGALDPALNIFGASVGNTNDTIVIFVRNETTFDASGFTFTDWTAPIEWNPADDRDVIVFFGDVDDETLTGSSSADEIYLSGGNDTATGGGGDDFIYLGPGIDRAIFSGNVADYTVVNEGNRLTVTDLRPGSPDGTDWLFEVELFEFADVTLPIGVDYAANFDGVLGDDLFFRRPDGTHYVANGATGAFADGLGRAGEDVIDFDDFADVTGDGITDTVFRRPNGNHYIYDQFNDVAYGLGRSTETFAATIDLDGDGISEIIFRRAAGNYYAVDTNSDIVVGYGRPDHTLLGIGDFDRDGRGDLLMARADGSYVWIDGATRAATGLSRNSTDIFLGIGDFNGDGFDDVLFERASNGAKVAFEADGAQITGFGRGVQDAVAIGDFNGDDIDDVVFKTPGLNYHVVVDGGTAAVISDFFDTGTVAAVGNFVPDLEDELVMVREDGTFALVDADGTHLVGYGRAGHTLIAFDPLGTGDVGDVFTS